MKDVGRFCLPYILAHLGMERAEISLHEVKVYRVFKEHSKAWLTHKDVAKISKINDRTVRSHTLRLIRLGVLDQAELFPQHRYRLSQKADKRNKGYKQRLDKADVIFASSPQEETGRTVVEQVNSCLFSPAR